MATLTLLRVLTEDAASLLTQLDERLAQAPDFFAGMPIVVTPAADVDPSSEWLVTLIEALRERRLLPVALSGVAVETAAAAGLGVIGNLEAPRSESAASPGRTHRESPSPSTSASSRFVTQPVRSGQQVYARGGDLIVTAPVSAGAELMADGHIHVYDTLRGRALAGVQGDENARIFCRAMRAELVAVAGQYLLSDQISSELRGASVMAWLRGDELALTAL
jgi:septum site-determining protein MinC